VAVDRFWHAAADHIRALGVEEQRVLAPAGFGALLPRCIGPRDLTASEQIDVLIVDKGRLGEVPPAILLAALDQLAVTFANEVFLVFTRSGDPVAPDNPHAMGREALLAAALHAAVAAPQPVARPARMPATYMGQGRVLLETAFGHLMLANGGDTAIVPHLIRDGWFDGNLTNAIIGALQPGMTFIDIGANFGTYTLIGAHAVGDEGQVIAIEPSPAIAALLRENVIMNGFAERCHVLPCALGDCEGTATLHEFATRQGSNTLLPQIADIARAEYDETITARTVPLRTLDAIIADSAPQRIDLIKIDVEGFEHQVLEGGRQTLARHRPKLIMEWHNGFFAGRPEAARALHELLIGDLGYTLQRIEAGGTTRPVTFDELMVLGHSDCMAEPAR
jgi:FkbM family methyltransferase